MFSWSAQCMQSFSWQGSRTVRAAAAVVARWHNQLSECIRRNCQAQSQTRQGLRQTYRWPSVHNTHHRKLGTGAPVGCTRCSCSNGAGVLVPGRPCTCSAPLRTPLPAQHDNKRTRSESASTNRVGSGQCHLRTCCF